MKRTFSAFYNNYELQVGEFENWSDALIEIEIGLTKLKVATYVGIGPICDCNLVPRGNCYCKAEDCMRIDVTVSSRDVER